MMGQADNEGLGEALKQAIRVGVVTSTDPAAGTVRAKLTDADALITYPLRVLNHKTLDDKTYWMPDIGEHVLCLFLPYGAEQGFVVGAFYSEADKVPVESQDKHHRIYKDGTWHEYDREGHKLHGNVKGEVDYTIDKDVTIKVKENVSITIKGDCSIKAEGDISIRSESHMELSAANCITWTCDQHGSGTF